MQVRQTEASSKCTSDIGPAVWVSIKMDEHLASAFMGPLSRLTSIVRWR